MVFDEAHNIDNVCIEALSVSLDRKILDNAARNLTALGNDVKRMRAADAARLQEEYNRLVSGLSNSAGGLSGGAARFGGASSSSSAAGGAASAAAGGAAAGSAAAGSAADGGEELPGPPVIPSDVLAEAVPGNIRNAELFVRFMKHVLR